MIITMLNVVVMIIMVKMIVMKTKMPHLPRTTPRLAVHEKYPVERARQARPNPSMEELREALSAAKENTNVKKVLIPMLG